MFRKLQTIFFNRKLGKNTRNMVRPPIRLLPFAEAKYIGLIAGASLLGKDLDALKNILQLFDQQGKTYFLIALCSEKRFPESLLGVPHILISKKDLLYGGVPSAKVLKKLKTHGFDLLIDMNRSANKTAFFIEATATSTLRIGKADNEREPFVDLMIEWRDTDNALQFLENIIFYLSMLTKGE
ncbi:MAG: hypothetical protein FWF09_03325 [Bacteroidales bacterium]|nr:hypothetical protein [Bacteroidales bacterium]